MKRTSAVPVTLLAVAITFGAAACGDDSPNASTDSTEATETTDAPGTTEPSETTETPDTTEPPEAPDSSDSTGDTTDTGAPEPGEEPTVESATPVLVGLTEDEATAAAEEQGWMLRVMRRDGEDLAGTLDLRPNRVNVEVTDDEVTAVLNIG